ncbi:IS1634 family transposase ISCsa8 [subsurface metagenome]
MYIRITKNQRGQAYYHLVESYRQDGKVKQRVLLSLGRVEENKLEELAEAINKHLETANIFNLAKEIDIASTYILGPLLVIERMTDELGVTEILKKITRDHERLQFDFQKVIFTQLCSRFIKPVSKLALYDNWIERLYPGMIDHDIELQHIYRSLDLLAQHKSEIEKFLYQWEKDLFTINVDVVLYDLTTLRFESTREDMDDLRRFGYSKEMRTDCTQVVLGLLTDTNGIPLCFEVHPGNTFEGNTLSSIVEKMQKKFAIRRFIFIADRGLFSFDNLEHIRNSQGEFIVGLKMGSMEKEMQEDFYQIKHFTWINEELAVYETKLREDRCIITWSKSRADRDRKTREDVIEKIKKKIAADKKKAKKLITNRNYKKYVKIEGKDQCELNHKAIAEEATKDGFFGVITNVTTMSPGEIVMNYKQLWKVEDAFGEIKGTLKTRPMFHWTDDRIIGHLVLCFLAYLCEAHLTKALRDSNELLEKKSITNKTIKSRQLTVVQAMDELAQVMAIPVKVRKETIWVRTDIPTNAANLMKAIGMKIPPKIIAK